MQQAYGLKQLTRASLLVGNLIHAAALHRITCIVADTPLPSFDTLMGQVRARMNAAYTALRCRSTAQLLAKPTRASDGLMLAEIYTGTVAPDEERARHALRTCLTHLCASELYPTLRAADPRDTLVLTP